MRPPPKPPRRTRPPKPPSRRPPLPPRKQAVPVEPVPAPTVGRVRIRPWKGAECVWCLRPVSAFAGKPIRCKWRSQLGRGSTRPVYYGFACSQGHREYWEAGWGKMHPLPHKCEAAWRKRAKTAAQFKALKGVTHEDDPNRR